MGGDALFDNRRNLEQPEQLAQEPGKK